jgi:hypothetical protein
MNISSHAPAEICRALLAALEASEGRRKRRQRNTTPDAIGITVKRELLERALQDDPAAENFEAWLMEYCAANSADATIGTLRATAIQVLEDWRLAHQVPQFREWLAHGAPSGDKP